MRIIVATGACTLLGACVTDPEIWEGVAMGLNATAAQLEYDNATCYWEPPEYVAFGAGAPSQPARRLCPGDHGYNPPPPVTDARYYDPPRHKRGRGRDNRNDRDRGH